MLEKFQQNNIAESTRRWLSEVDLDSADVLSIERDIYSALKKGVRRVPYQSPFVAPFAEPVDLNALVGDIFTESNEELRYQVGRLDFLYSWLSEANNVLKSEIESVEKAVTQATDDIQEISIVVGDENRNFYWISDSFNSNLFIDSEKTTALIDTDYGMATLGPKSLDAIVDYEASLDRNGTNGIPGANTYIVNKGKTYSNGSKEPEPIVERVETRNFGAIFDLDPSSWFEVERVFIAPSQKVNMEGRAYVYSETGQEKNILEITKKYDWKAIIGWPDGYQDAGEDGKGKDIVEWRNLDADTTVSANEASFNSLQDPNVHLVVELNLKNPQPISSIKILPFVREDAAPITIDSLQVLAGEDWIDVAKDIELGTNKSTTRLQREILRRTGAQLIGSLFDIPTDREITKLRLVFTSKPSLLKNGIAHIFQDIQTKHRTERNHGLWRSVDTWKEWNRKPFNENPPLLKSSNTRPAIVGTVMGAVNIGKTIGSLYNSAAAAGSVIGGTLGSVGAWLGRAVPYLGALLALDSLVGGLFSVKKSVKVIDSRRAYDIFRGYRAAIALRDITLIRTKYTEESTVQSTKREFPREVSKIGLFVDDYVPEHWGPGDWLAYYISVDGTNWISVPKLSDSTLEKSLVLVNPTREVYFKAVIKGNPEDPNHTPRVKHYAIQGLPND